MQKTYRRRLPPVLLLALTCLVSIESLGQANKSLTYTEDILPILSTGQWLSIPLIILGLIFIFYSNAPWSYGFNKKKRMSK